MHRCFDLRFAGELCGKERSMDKVTQNLKSMASVSSEKPLWVFAVICGNKLTLDKFRSYESCTQHLVTENNLHILTFE